MSSTVDTAEIQVVSEDLSVPHNSGKTSKSQQWFWVAAFCPLCSPQPTIGKSRGSRTGRGSGMTSPCLSFLTQRCEWRSPHSFCWPHTASWPQVWLCPPCLHPRQNLEGGTHAPVIFNTSWPNSSVRLRTTVPGEEIASGKGDRMPHTVSASPSWSSREGMNTTQLCLSIFYSREKAEETTATLFPSSTRFLVGDRGRPPSCWIWGTPNDLWGRERHCPTQQQGPGVQYPPETI